MHPSEFKLYKPLKTSGLQSVALKTPQNLDHIVLDCESCKNIRSAPKRYRAIIGTENTRLDFKVYIDFIYIKESPALHMIDVATNFNAAQCVDFLTNYSVEQMILTLRKAV